MTKDVILLIQHFCTGHCYGVLKNMGFTIYKSVTPLFFFLFAPTTLIMKSGVLQWRLSSHRKISHYYGNGIHAEQLIMDQVFWHFAKRAYELSLDFACH